jgi:hypothetical protein
MDVQRVKQKYASSLSPMCRKRAGILNGSKSFERCSHSERLPATTFTNLEHYEIIIGVEMDRVIITSTISQPTN